MVTAWALLDGDCLAVLPTLEASSVGSVVTDPPYGLEFMGMAWDTMREDGRPRTPNEWGDFGSREHARNSGELGRITRNKAVAFQRFSEAWSQECFRVMKPGAYVVAFGGTRTYHRMACAIEDAGFVIKDSLHWIYGSGFPKSLNLGDGYGTALKPAHEPIILAQKPLQGTYAANVARHGVGCLNIDGCRIPSTDNTTKIRTAGDRSREQYRTGTSIGGPIPTDIGRWPTNLLLTHHPDCNGACVPGCPIAVLDAQSGITRSSGGINNGGGDTPIYGTYANLAPRANAGGLGDVGGASRFFPTFRFEADDFAPFLYMAKAARSEREKGLRPLAKATPGERTGRKEGSAGLDSPRAGAGRTNAGANIHPTVKPLALMRWLVRLITPPGQTVLDPFLGSGTTGVAAVMEGRGFVGVEREAAYMAISRRRLETTQPGIDLAAATAGH